MSQSDDISEQALISLRKSFLSCKTCKGLGEDLHFKWAEKEVTIYVFSSECCKEREVRANNQEKNLSKVQLSQGECEAILISIIIVFTTILTFFSFSKQKNFLLVGTADGNLAIFEDKTVKVNIEHILHQNLNCFMFVHHQPPSDYKLPDTKDHVFCFLSFHCFRKSCTQQIFISTW